MNENLGSPTYDAEDRSHGSNSDDYDIGIALGEFTLQNVFLFSAFIYGILNSDAPQQFQLFHSPYGIHFNSFLAFNVQLNRMNQCYKFIVRAH